MLPVTLTQSLHKSSPHSFEMIREVFIFIFMCPVVNVWSTPSPPSLLARTTVSINTDIIPKLDLTTLAWFRITISTVVLLITWLSCVSSSDLLSVHAVPYNIPLNIVSYRNLACDQRLAMYDLLFIPTTLLLDPCEFFDAIPFVLNLLMDTNFQYINLLQISRTIKPQSFNANTVVFLAASCSQITHTLCIFVLTLFFSHHFRKPTSWYLALILLLSHDIETNPGPHSFNDNYLSFMNWNLNSLATDNFSRTHMLEAHNSLYNYDIISLCETSLTEETTLQVPKIEGYTYEPGNHPDDVSRGGVGVYYKDSLPVVVRRDLSFDESLVLELKFPRKKIFFTVLYRSPSFNHKSEAFAEFLDNLKNLHTKISTENHVEKIPHEKTQN